MTFLTLTAAINAIGEARGEFIPSLSDAGTLIESYDSWNCNYKFLAISPTRQPTQTSDNPEFLFGLTP